MTTYEKLTAETEKEDIYLVEYSFDNKKIKGLYIDKTITINKNIKTEKEKNCVLAEELGHHFTSTGDILNQKKTENERQEKKARNWAYEKLVSLDKLISAYVLGVRDKHELADYLDVTVDFLKEAIKHYKEKYGLYTQVNKYIIYFEPLGILRKEFEQCQEKK